MVGFYDSGMGGLTIVHAFLQKYPQQCMYYADTLHAPLGEKSPEEIELCVKQGISKLFEAGCDLVILACNTATVACIREVQGTWLRQKWVGKQVLGVVKPVQEELVNRQLIDSVEPVLVMATPATCNSGFYQQELRDIGISHADFLPCPSLSLAIDSAQDNVNDLLASYFLTLDTSVYRTAVLACTHYPLVLDDIAAYFSPETTFISQSECASERLVSYLQRNPHYVTGNQAKVRCIVSGEIDDFSLSVTHYFPWLTSISEVV